MSATVSFDTRDIVRFEQTCKRLGEKTALKAARKAAQKGSNVVGKAIRSAAPVGATGQLKRGFKKKKEKPAEENYLNIQDYLLLCLLHFKV